MIRKILFYLSVLAIIFWLTGVYYIKGKLIESVSVLENDNIKVSFDNANIGGFPFGWKITLTNPKIVLIAQNAAQELSARHITFNFDYSLKYTNIKLPGTLSYHLSRIQGNQYYQLVSGDNIETKLYFVDSLYKAVFYNLSKQHSVRSLNIKAPNLKIVYEDSAIFHINDVDLGLLQECKKDLDIYKIKLSGNYLSLVSSAEIKKSSLLMNFDYMVVKEDSGGKQNGIFDRCININKFKFKVDDSVLDVNGLLNLHRSTVPRGYLEVSMLKYQNIVDLFVPDGFFLSRPRVKKIIAKSSLNLLNRIPSNGNEVKLRINFLDTGVFIDKFNLLEPNIDL